MNCPVCNQRMVRASYYDPDGQIPLYGGVRDQTDWWICTATQCPNGRRNRSSVALHGDSEALLAP